MCDLLPQECRTRPAAGPVWLLEIMGPFAASRRCVLCVQGHDACTRGDVGGTADVCGRGIGR